MALRLEQFGPCEAILPVSALIAGGSKRSVDDPLVWQVSAGRTRKHEARWILGEPDSVQVGDGEAAWTFAYWESTMRPERQMPTANVVVGGRNRASASRAVAFDENSVLGAARRHPESGSRTSRTLADDPSPGPGTTKEPFCSRQPR